MKFIVITLSESIKIIDYRGRIITNLQIAIRSFKVHFKLQTNVGLRFWMSSMYLVTSLSQFLVFGHPILGIISFLDSKIRDSYLNFFSSAASLWTNLVFSPKYFDTLVIAYYSGPEVWLKIMLEKKKYPKMI